MIEINILSKEEVVRLGKEFDCEIIDYGSEPGFEYGICERSSSGREELFSGIVYELYPNGNLAYYMTVLEGAKHGDSVEFYRSGNLKEFTPMRYGTLTGKSISWHDNGNLRSEKVGKYGGVLSFKEWDEDGKLIKEVTEPTETHRKLMEMNEKNAKNDVSRQRYRNNP